jgi:hypothetical protein
MSRTRVLSSAFALALLPFAAHALDPGLGIELVLAPADYAGCGSVSSLEATACEDLDSPGLPVGTRAFLWIAVTYHEGFPADVGGVQFGIHYSDLEIDEWSLCTGGIEIRQEGWPDSGTGNALTWSGGCHTPENDVAVVGFLAPRGGSICSSTPVEPSTWSRIKRSYSRTE